MSLTGTGTTDNTMPLVTAPVRDTRTLCPSGIGSPLLRTSVKAAVEHTIIAKIIGQTARTSDDV
ncbi:hypothetical protein TSUKUMMB_50910 [Rhodococcus sp. no. 34]